MGAAALMLALAVPLLQASAVARLQALTVAIRALAQQARQARLPLAWMPVSVAWMATVAATRR